MSTTTRNIRSLHSELVAKLDAANQYSAYGVLLKSLIAETYEALEDSKQMDEDKSRDRC